MTSAADVGPPSDARRRQRFAPRQIIPGVAVAVTVAIAARAVHAVLPSAVADPIGAVIVAVAFGFVIANTAGTPEWMRPGLKVCVSSVLRVAIVLLGARLAVSQVLAIGGEALLLIVVLMVTALLVAHALARLTNTPAKVASLVGVGVSVCGNTAIIATAPAIGASDEDVSTAIAVNTLFGMLAVFLYPIIGHALRLDAAVFGTWAGTAVNDTSQVVAVGFAYGAVAGQIATTVKLARNALMGVVVVGMGLLHRDGTTASSGAAVRHSFPLFVIGFLLMAAANSIGVFDWLSDAVGFSVVPVLSSVAQFLLLVALAAVGLLTSAAGLRTTGWRPFAVGFGAATATSLASFGLIWFRGPAGG